MKSRTSSKAAHLGIRQGKNLLSSAWSNLSAQTSKIGTRQALTSLRSGLTSAATSVSILIFRARRLVLELCDKVKRTLAEDENLYINKYWNQTNTWHVSILII